MQLTSVRDQAVTERTHGSVSKLAVSDAQRRQRAVSSKRVSCCERDREQCSHHDKIQVAREEDTNDGVPKRTERSNTPFADSLPRRMKLL